MKHPFHDSTTIDEPRCDPEDIHEWQLRCLCCDFKDRAWDFDNAYYAAQEHVMQTGHVVIATAAGDGETHIPGHERDMEIEVRFSSRALIHYPV